jgi:hypothetical protein
MFICDPLRAAEGSERESSNVGISPVLGLAAKVSSTFDSIVHLNY